MARAPNSSPPAALPVGPAAQAFRVEDLVASVRAGRVRIPKFQAPLRWELADVLSLLDSIYRGYPVGTLLLWRRPAFADLIVHGSVRIVAPVVTDALWVVDGQQRILALTRALAGAGFPDEPLAVFFDLGREVFLRPGPGQTPQAHHLPLTEVLDPERLSKWIRERPLPEAQQHAALGLGERLREYPIAAHVVSTDDEGVVREIFRRTNRTRKQIGDSEVFDALGSAGGMPGSAAELARSLRAVGLGLLDEPTLLQMLVAMRGADPTVDPSVDLAPKQVRQAMEDLMRGARATLVFLRDDARIPHISLLPYRSTLFTLMRFFHRHPAPHPRSRELLARWLWRGALTGAHSASAMGREIGAADAHEHTAVQALLGMVPDAGPLPIELDGYSFDQPRCKIGLLALLDLRPVDVRSGASVFTAMPDGDDPYRSMVRFLGGPGDADGSFAAVILHPAVSDGLARAVTHCTQSAWLASHAILDPARQALALARFDDFVALRAATLERHIADFAERRAQWEEADTPPVEALRVESA